MTYQHNFYNIYNRDYDYDIDIKILNDYLKLHKIHCLKLIELGCGTGKHTQRLSKIAESVIAIDKDPYMLRQAIQNILEQGIENVSFFHLPAQDLKKNNIQFCDVAYSFFNMINYVTDFNTLVDVFSGISEILKPSGIFIFDCLDADQQYTEKFSSTLSYKSGNQTLSREIKSTYDPKSHIINTTEVYSGLTGLSNFSYKEKYKLWNSEQIELIAQKSGMSIAQYDKKININKKQRTRNQTVYFMKKLNDCKINL